MRVLMLIPRPGIRGPMNSHTPVLISHLRELGCDVVTESWGRHTDEEGIGAKGIGRLSDVWCVRQALKRNHYDIMVVKTAHDWLGLVRDAALLAATRGLVPRRILQFHGCQLDRLDKPGGGRLFKLLSQYVAKSSDALMVLSTQEAREWRRFCPDCSCHVVQNPFVAPRFSAAISEANGRENRETKPVILFVGRLMREKGLFELVDALPAVLRERACRLEIVGDGSAADAVRGRVEELGIGAHVAFLGYCKGEELWRAYRGASLFVLPSWSEGFPTVLAEAMAAGLPIITTRIQGMADHVAEGINGLFVPVRSPAALAAAMVRLLGNSALRARMSAANREKVMDFAPAKVAAHYLEVISAVCK